MGEKKYTLAEVADIIMDMEIMITINGFFNHDGTHKTKTEYGKMLITNLCKQLRDK